MAQTVADSLLFAYSDLRSSNMATAAACPECKPTDITPDCTDQCVVIACDDPEHGGQLCTADHARCELICDGFSDCSACNGLDQFLQCCVPTAPPMPWDPAHFFHRAMEQDHFSDASTEIQSPFFRPAHIPQSPLIMPGMMPPPILPIQSPPETQIEVQPFRCMWGHCGTTFSSLPELVGHVNLAHLHPPSSTTGDPPPVAAVAQSDAPSCMWKDCADYSSPSMIPSSSNGDYNDILDFLASHLYQEHLGLQSTSFGALPTNILPPPLSNPQEQSPSLLPTPPESSVETSVSPSPSQEQPEDQRSQPSDSQPEAHHCSGTHICAWKDCGQIFDSCDDLTTHLNSTHVGSGKAHYDCFWDGCTRNGEGGFASKQKICRHLQSHTGHRPFQCTICQQFFSEAATLQQHMRRHTQEKPYECDYPGCGKRFAITGALTIHKRTHNGHKPFKCTYCDRAFSESSNLSKHLRTHTGDKPYSCDHPDCGKSFARPDQLTRHMNVHSKKPKGKVISEKVLVAV